MKFEKITYAGHSAIFVEGIHKGSKVTVAVDPWLTGNPSCPESLQSKLDIDVICLTHGHSDHAGDAFRLLRESSAVLAATWELAMIFVREGIPESRVIPMNKGGSVEHLGVRISLTHAMHSNSYDTASGPVYAGEACGVVLSDGLNALYHAGDTALFSDMELIKSSYHPTVAFLPIGDRFTMGPKEAHLAAKLINPKVVVPIHWGTFPLLTGSADEFKKLCEGDDINVKVLKGGEEMGLF